MQDRSAQDRRPAISARRRSFVFSASLDPAVSAQRLSHLLVEGTLDDPDLVRRGERLHRLFQNAARTSPALLWAPGLLMDREMRGISETFLPWEEIAPSVSRLIRCSLRYHSPINPCDRFSSWPDFLSRAHSGVASANPANLLHHVMTDETFRRHWLFSLHLPKEHGNGFDRYPGQQKLLGHWLAKRRTMTGHHLSCLDAACGSGEGTWELLELCRGCGFTPPEVTVRGSSLDPLEIFAAAHASFPHDHAREKAYRHRIHPLLTNGFVERLNFVAEDLAILDDTGETYDLILCNGLIGGPLLHGPAAMERVLSGLTRQLKPGGLLAATDHFHEGWSKRTPLAAREELLAQCGLKILRLGEGIWGENAD